MHQISLPVALSTFPFGISTPVLVPPGFALGNNKIVVCYILPVFVCTCTAVCTRTEHVINICCNYCSLQFLSYVHQDSEDDALFPSYLGLLLKILHTVHVFLKNLFCRQ